MHSKETRARRRAMRDLGGVAATSMPERQFIRLVTLVALVLRRRFPSFRDVC